MKYMLLLLIDYQAILIIILLTLYCTSYNLLKMFMKYNLINLTAFNELQKIIRQLYVIYDNYEYFSTASVNIIIDLTITVLNCAADVIISDGEFIGVGDYACMGVVKHVMDKDELFDFIHVVEDTRRKIADDNQHLWQD